MPRVDSPDEAGLLSAAASDLANQRWRATTTPPTRIGDRETPPPAEDLLRLARLLMVRRDMARGIRWLALMFLGVVGPSPAMAAVDGVGLTVADGRVRGAVPTSSLAAIVEEIVERAGGTVRWVQARPQQRTAARFADEPVLEVVRRLLDGGSLTVVLDRRGQVREVVVLQSPPGSAIEPEAEPVAQREPPADFPVFTKQPDGAPASDAARRRLARLGQPGRDGHIPALLKVLRASTNGEATALAVEGLARIGSPRAMAELAALVHHGADETVRSQAGKSLESMAERDPTAQALLNAVNHARLKP